jgi:glycosyltransferase involved in cell wall biosynthesis
MEQTKLSLSVILPLKSAVVKDFKDFFEKAIKSINSNSVGIHELVIVHTPEEQLVNFIEEFNFENLSVKKVLFTESPNYSSQINEGIKNATGKWVSFFEFDDEYSSIWFKNVQEYINYYPEVDVFLPVVVDTDDKGGFAGFTNEASFAANFTQEMGYLTNETLQTYQNFQSAGAVFKKESLDNFGGFKPSMKLTFVYELLLRLTYNSVKIMTIPRLGYKHLNLREGSIFWNYKYSTEKMLEDEIKFWIQSAKKEYFFTEDRTIKYEGQTT